MWNCVKHVFWVKKVVKQKCFLSEKKKLSMEKNVFFSEKKIEIFTL